MTTLYWTFLSPAHAAAGAIPPEPMRLPYGEQSPASPFRSGSYGEIWRAIERGYSTYPSDCPPVRIISRFGFIVHCPGRVCIRRVETPRRERIFAENYAAFGMAEMEGDPWPASDSGLIASWILGSEFVKIQTGIRVLFPHGQYLYQGPLPNRTLIANAQADVMAGLEYASHKRTVHMGGHRWGVADINVIVRLPPVGETLQFTRGDGLAWFFLIPSHQTLEALPCGTTPELV